MTVALPAPAPAPAPRHPRLALRQEPPHAPDDDASTLVAYVVLLPRDTDPVALFARTGLRPPIRSVDLDDTPSTVPVRVRGNARTSCGPYPSPGPIRIDTGRRVAELNGAELDLTYMEFALLARLVESPGQVHSREQLVQQVWGYEHVGDGRTVDVHIARLRRKLGPAHRHRIVTVRRAGYKYLHSA